jgi:serine/threonine protein kinase/predicted ATPase
LTSSRHNKVSDIFLRACELGLREREVFLDEACAGDAELRREVESLLQHDSEQLIKTGGGAVKAASLLSGSHDVESPDRDDSGPARAVCVECGNIAPHGHDRCPACSATATMLGDAAFSLPGYTILKLLGKGGMGKVYLAEDSVLGRRVAIKVISEQFSSDVPTVQRFVREARTMATVEHPHIVRVYSFGEVEGRQYLVMEYVKGESLSTRIRSLGRLDAEEALRILSETLEALAAAWGHGIIHRDIKPANILLDEAGRVRVADFGLAKVTEVEGDASITRDGQVVGTPHYLSPEQARGEGRLDFRTDIYSLGIVLYEMLTGEPPFRGATPISIVDQHLHAMIPALGQQRPDIPGEYEQLCEWMVRKRPEDRPENYEELQRSVAALLGAEQPSPDTAPPLPSFLYPEPDSAAIPAIFVGREQELERLDRSLVETLRGDGRVALVAGEAGSGKTALISEFARRAQESHEKLIVAVGNCDAQTGIGDPYLPFREILSLLTADVEFRRASGGIHREQARRLWGLLPHSVEALIENGPDLLGTFISGEALVARSAAFTPSPARWRVRLEEQVRRSAALPRDAGLQQSYLFEQYARTLHALARDRPLLLQLEDLQWADGGSCGLLFHLVRRIAHASIFIVCTYRPAEIELERQGKRHPMGPVLGELQRQFGDLEIHVGEEQSREFIDQLLDHEPNELGGTFRDRLYRQTRGHPLFTVELLGNLRDQGMLILDDSGRWVEGPAMNWDMLPARVEGAIGERVARLPEDLRATLTLASVQGEEFVAEVLAQLQGKSTRETVSVLSTELDKRHRLVAAQGVRRLNGKRISTYRFRHNLFQKYLYGQMDEMERSYTHEDVGNALETLFANHADEVAPQLARHFDMAGIVPKAIDYLQRAGERATRLSANEEAIDHFRHALRIVAAQPDTEERARQELALQLSLGPPLLTTVGPGSEQLSDAYLRAQVLCDKVGVAAQRFQTLFILVHHHGNRGRGTRALEIAEQLVRLVESTKEPLPAVMAYWARGFSLLYLARVAESLRDHERVISIYDSDRDASLAYIFGMDPAVSSLSFGGVALWTLGYPDRALEYCERGIAYARELNHPSTLAHALLQILYQAMTRSDFEPLAELAEELVRLSTEHHVELFRAWGLLAEGWALAIQGQYDLAIERMQQGLADSKATGSELGHPMAMWALADVYRKAGQIEAALDLVTEAISMADRTEDRLHEAELFRSRGELLLELDPNSTEQARASLAEAIGRARDAKLRLWELRASMSMGRLLQSLGREEQARELLGGIHGWFTEGLQMPDLQEAARLLDQLS